MSALVTAPKKHTTHTHQRGRKTKAKRVTCAVCGKPAVMYYEHRGGKTRVTFEHRDEEPLKTYEYRGKTFHRYRRCNGGTISEEGLPPRDDAITLEEAIKINVPTLVSPSSPSPTFQGYEKKYKDLIHELTNIVYDVDGDTAVRMIKNIRRMLNAEEDEA